MPADPTDFSSLRDAVPEELVAAATELFETARPWLAAALAEHTAHPDGEPGTCRLCLLGGAVTRNVEPFTTEASRLFGKFADVVMADLIRLAEELLDGARVAVAAVTADYASTAQAAAGAAPSDSESATSDAAAAPAPGGGYERIDIRLVPEPPDGTAV